MPDERRRIPPVSAVPPVPPDVPQGLRVVLDAMARELRELRQAVVAAGVDIKGPTTGTSTDNAIARWDGTDADRIQNSGILIDDARSFVSATPDTVGAYGFHFDESVIAPGGRAAGSYILGLKKGTGSSPYALRVSDEAIPKLLIGRPGVNQASYMTSNEWGLEGNDVGGLPNLFVSPAGAEVKFQTSTAKNLYFFVTGASKYTRFDLDATNNSDAYFHIRKIRTDGGVNNDIVQIEHTNATVNGTRNLLSATVGSTKGFQLDKNFGLIWNGRVVPGVARPAVIGSTPQNDYALPEASTVFLSGTPAPTVITGFTNGVEGRRLVVINDGATNLRFDNLTGSAAANQIRTFNGTNITIGANEGAVFVYDGTATKWRLLFRST